MVLTKSNHSGCIDFSVLRYNREFEKIIILKEGSYTLLRPLIPCDYKELGIFFENLGRETLYSRYLTSSPEIKRREIQRIFNSLYKNNLIIVAKLANKASPIIGIAELCSSKMVPDTAEAAITIMDDWQGKRAGIQMLQWLRVIAENRGIKTVVGYCSVGNQKVLSLLRKLGQDYYSKVDGPILYFEISLDRPLNMVEGDET